MKKLMFGMFALLFSSSIFGTRSISTPPFEWAEYTCLVVGDASIPDYKKINIPNGSRIRFSTGKMPNELKLMNATIQNLSDDERIYFEDPDGKLVTGFDGAPIYHWLYAEILQAEASMGGYYYLAVGAPGQNDIVVILVDSGPFNNNKEVVVTYRGIATDTYLELVCK